MRYPKKFTWKGFMKFDWEKQEILCKRYNIILTDYTTKQEKVKNILGKFTVTNINLGVAKFNKGVQQFSNMMGTEKQQRPRTQRRSRSTYREPKLKPMKVPNLWGSDKDQAKAIKDLLG